MKIKPLYNYVLVRPNALEVKTKSGLILTEINQTAGVTVQSGEVLAVGDGMVTSDGKLMPLQVKVGDTVWFRRGGNYQIIKELVDSEELYLFKEVDLLGIMPETESDKIKKLLDKKEEVTIV